MYPPGRRNKKVLIDGPVVATVSAVRLFVGLGIPDLPPDDVVECGGTSCFRSICERVFFQSLPVLSLAVERFVSCPTP
jgi:hypothetical protein